MNSVASGARSTHTKRMQKRSHGPVVQKKRTSRHIKKFTAPQIDFNEVVTKPVLTKFIADFFTFSDLSQFEQTSNMIKNVVANTLCWKAASPSQTALAIDAAIETVSSFLTSVEAFSAKIEFELSEAEERLVVSRQRVHFWGYWCLACDQKIRGWYPFLEKQYSYAMVKRVEDKIRAGIYNDQWLHKHVTHRIEALSVELKQLAAMHQGKPLLVRCLQILSGKVFSTIPKHTRQVFALIRFQIIFVEAVMKILCPEDEVFTEYCSKASKYRGHGFEMPDHPFLEVSRGWWIPDNYDSSESEYRFNVAGVE